MIAHRSAHTTLADVLGFHLPNPLTHQTTRAADGPTRVGRGTLRHRLEKRQHKAAFANAGVAGH
jgi:hypothetical protein